jgi:GNAT superfamily N-acetyltransferase
VSRYSEIEALSTSHDRKSFDCGNEQLNIWLRQFARQSQSSDLTRTWVVCLKDTNRIVGFSTLVAGAEAREDVPDSMSRRAGGHPVPFVVLARLAVDVTEQKCGLGRALLKDTLVKAEGASRAFGIAGVAVQAKDEEAASWYRKWDFEPSPTDPLHLFLSMKDIRQALTP